MSDPIIDSKNPNDVVDIYGEPKVTVKVLKSDYFKELKLQIEGPDVGPAMMNAIRRTIMEDIPVYGIHHSNLFVDHKRCNYMYDNDLMGCQFEALPIFDIENSFELESPLLYLSTPALKEQFSVYLQDVDPEREMRQFVPKKVKKVEIGLSYKNTSNVPYYVSTHDLVLKVDGEIVDSYKKYTHVDILVLNPGQEVHLKALATPGIAKYHAIWEASTLAIHEKITPTKYILTYETIGQLDKVVIFQKALNILAAQLINLRDYVKENIKPVGTKEFKKHLKGVGDTLGGVITQTLQRCPLVEIAGFTKDHMFINTGLMAFRVIEKTKKDPVEVLIDVFDYLIKMFQGIKI